MASSMPTQSLSRRSQTTSGRQPTWWTRSVSTTEPNFVSAASSVGRPLTQGWPASPCMRWSVAGAAAGAALLALLPILSLIVLAFGDTGDLWSHLTRHVIPTALVQTTLLLAGVAAVTI